MVEIPDNLMKFVHVSIFLIIIDLDFFLFFRIQPLPASKIQQVRFIIKHNNDNYWCILIDTKRYGFID
jgi:hypothetical protein